MAPALHEKSFADGVLLLGHEDDAEAAFADFLQQLVAANHRAEMLVGRWLGYHRNGRCRTRRRWKRAEEIIRSRLGTEQCFEPFAQGWVAGAGAIQEHGAMNRVGQPSRRFEKSFGLLFTLAHALSTQVLFLAGKPFSGQPTFAPESQLNHPKCPPLGPPAGAADDS